MNQPTQVVAFHSEYDNEVTLLPLEPHARSIFDIERAYETDINGQFYYKMIDYRTREEYVVARDNHKTYREVGRVLDENEEAVFHGERVRGMTFSEEMSWNQEYLYTPVDIWGNIAVDAEYDD